jgi:Ca2+-binding EF-hand superfamily protein
MDCRKRCRGVAGVVILNALAFLALPAQADETGPAKRTVDAAQLADSLPAATVRRIRRAPARFIEVAADEISTYGKVVQANGVQGVGGQDTGGQDTGGAIDAAGIDLMIAADRARIRAAEAERILRADLDGDGAVSMAERQTVIAILPEGQKGRLELAWRVADSDKSGIVDLAEVLVYAQGVAITNIDNDDVARAQDILKFDMDGDGAVAIDEVIAGVAALRNLNLSRVKEDI